MSQRVTLARSRAAKLALWAALFALGGCPSEPEKKRGAGGPGDPPAAMAQPPGDEPGEAGEAAEAGEGPAEPRPEDRWIFDEKARIGIGGLDGEWTLLDYPEVSELDPKARMGATWTEHGCWGVVFVEPKDPEVPLEARGKELAAAAPVTGGTVQYIDEVGFSGKVSRRYAVRGKGPEGKSRRCKGHVFYAGALQYHILTCTAAPFLEAARRCVDRFTASVAYIDPDPED